MRKQCAVFVFLLLLQVTSLRRPMAFVVTAEEAGAQPFDPANVILIYANTERAELERRSTHVEIIFTGFHKQEVFASILSPCKPIVITSNNTWKPFIELEYDPAVMPVNPIVETDQDYAWDYDFKNYIVSLKLVLSSTNTLAMVRVTIYYVVSACIMSFSSDRSNYSVYDPVKIHATVSAIYTANSTADWRTCVLIVQNSTGKVFQRAYEKIVLRTNEQRNLYYDFRPIPETGIYVAIARVSDPSNDNVVAYSDFTFRVTGLGPTESQPVVPGWLEQVLLSVFIISVSMLVFIKSKDKIWNLTKRKPRPSQVYFVL